MSSNCFSFDRYNGFSIGTLSELGLRQSNFSVSVWVKIAQHNTENSSQKFNTILGQNDGFSANNCIVLAIQDKKLFFGFYGDDTFGRTELCENKWHHVGFVYDMFKQTQTIFLNGKIDAVGENKKPIQGSPNSIVFLSKYAQERGLIGKMTEFHIWHTILTKEEINKILETDIIGYTQTKPEWINKYDSIANDLPFNRSNLTDSTILPAVLEDDRKIQSSAPLVQCLRPEATNGYIEVEEGEKSIKLQAINFKPVQYSCPECKTVMTLCPGLNLRNSVNDLVTAERMNSTGIFACYRVFTDYKGFVLRLRRSLDDEESDFYADFDGTLSSASGELVQDWGNGSHDLFVHTWYNQANNEADSFQLDKEHQPRYIIDKKLLDFGKGSFLSLNAKAFPIEGSQYSYIVKHGEVRNDLGGFFGVGSDLRRGSCVCFRRNNDGGYIDYWWGNDQFFGKYKSGNLVMETSREAFRKSYINSLPVSFFRSLKRTTTATDGFIGKTIYDNAACPEDLDGELEYLMFFSKELVLPRSAVVLTDSSHQCPNCSMTIVVSDFKAIENIRIELKLNDKRRIGSISFRFRHGVVTVSRGPGIKKIEPGCIGRWRLEDGFVYFPLIIIPPIFLIYSLIFCIVTSIWGCIDSRKRASAVKKNKGSFEYFSLSASEKIARISFQQDDQYGLRNIKLVTNTGRESPLFGMQLSRSGQTSYTYTAPPESGGIFGLIRTEPVFGISGILLQNGKVFRVNQKSLKSQVINSSSSVPKTQVISAKKVRKSRGGKGRRARTKNDESDEEEENDNQDDEKKSEENLIWLEADDFDTNKEESNNDDLEGAQRYGQEEYYEELPVDDLGVGADFFDSGRAIPDDGWNSGGNDFSGGGELFNEGGGWENGGDTGGGWNGGEEQGGGGGGNWDNGGGGRGDQSGGGDSG